MRRGRTINALLHVHQQLPAGVNPFPTLKGKKRFDMLQAFNLVLAFYILLHLLIVPLSVYLLQTRHELRTFSPGLWYLYHFALALFLSERHRNPKNAFRVVYLAWFAVGYLPLTLGASFFEQGILRFKWSAISGLLSYGSSLVLTCFLLYRMRMPTTAYLFKLESRLIPKWRYAIPYAALGLVLSLFWIACPFAAKFSTPPETPFAPKTNNIVERRYQYD